MTGIVIPFPNSPNRGSSPASCVQPLGVFVEAALKVHEVIVTGLRSGEFDGHEGSPGVALFRTLVDRFGFDFVIEAEEQFENVYGSDPYTFMRRLIGYRPTGDLPELA